MGNMVEFASNGNNAHGYLAEPSGGPGSGPGVVVIQEWWGLVGQIQSVADRFAGAGYVALAPDLYHGESTSSPDDAGKLMMALDIERAEKDLRGACDFLATKASGDKLGVVGFCMGGQLALFAASKNDRIAACVDFYGIHPNVKPVYTDIKGAVLGLFAEKDAFVTAEAVSGLESALKAAGVETDFHTYPGVDHAFFNDERDVYDEVAAKDAWERVMSLFQAKL